MMLNLALSMQTYFEGFRNRMFDSSLSDMTEERTMKFVVASLAGMACIGGVHVYRNYLLSSSDHDGCDLHRQCRKDSEGNFMSLHTTGDETIATRFDTVKTEYEAFMMGRKISKNGHCMGTRNGDVYEWLTYDQVYMKFRSFGAGLIRNGLKPGQSTFFGIYMRTRMEWMIAAFACSLYSIVTIPLYNTLGMDSLIYIVKHVHLEYVVCDDNSNAIKLLANEEIRSILKILIMVCDVISDELTRLCNDNRIKLLKFSDITGDDFCQENICKGEDLAVVMYTSGTTGDPKGVMLTHQNIIAVASSYFIQLDHHSICMDSDAVYMSFLPLAHGLERSIHNYAFMTGSAIGYYSGDMKNIKDDAAILKPYALAMVPRLLNRFHDIIMGKIHGPVRNVLFYIAMKSWSSDAFRQRLFHSARSAMGEHLGLVIIGAAPIERIVNDRMSKILGCNLLEGYGLSEAVAACTLMLPNDTTFGHVGPPLPCVKMKFVDVKEMKYFAKDNRGEVCFKGPSVMKGYYKQPELTAGAIDQDGWLHTGDIGCLTNAGALQIIDRKKSIFKLAQGEYIAPEKIENIYCNGVPCIAQIFVYGDSLKSQLVAIVFPDELILQNQFASISNDIDKLCSSKAVIDRLMDEMTDVGRAAGLFGFEQVKSITLSKDPMTIENGLLTPTLKSKRSVIVARYRHRIDDMYKALGPV